MVTPSTLDTDVSLLRQFAQERSETALRFLTERHLNLVFGTALRRTGDRGAAEEITQNVFIALARKAAWLQREASLAAWLHQATVLESRQWWRGESRRRQREQTAISLETTMKTSDENAPAMAAVLDEALLELRQGERQAVLLRFFEGRNHREIGAALGIGEDAARKRVDKSMDQLSAFFRKRGFAVSSAAVVGILTGSATSAPAGLAAAVVRATMTAGGAPAAAWLVKLLGLGKSQLAAICMAALLVPTVWQQARLVSARAEQRRMESLLVLLQSQNAGIADELTQVRRQLDRAAGNPTQTNAADTGASGSSVFDNAIYLWNQNADYVRVPKEVMRRIGFGSTLDHSKMPVMDAGHGRFSPVLLAALGLSEKEQASAQEAFSQDLNAYRAWAEANSYLTEYSKIDTAALGLPKGVQGSPNDFLHVTDDTRAWVIPSIPADGGSWRAQSVQKLASAMGQERGQLLLDMAGDDGSLDQCLRQYGAKGSSIIITPNPDGGFWLSQNAKDGNWTFGTPCSFSAVLEPVADQPFDEKAVRKQLEQRTAQARSQFPDQEIPSIDVLVEQYRKDWQTGQYVNHPNPAQIVLGRPLPQPMIDYLRQWRSAHPDAPDAVPAASLPHHP